MAHSKPVTLGDYVSSALSAFDGQDDGCIGVGPNTLGLDGQLGPFFAAVVDALVQHPIPGLPIVAGENGATAASSTLFWTYDQRGGFTLEATPGYLTTAAGNGGFSMHVAPDGSWSLTFDGSGNTIGHYAGEPAVAPPPPPPGNTLVNTLVNPDLPGDKWTEIAPNEYSADASKGNITFDGTQAPAPSFDTVQGGVGDYIIGGTAVSPGATREFSGGLALGNCAIYSESTSPVLVDGENGYGYGGSAEGNVLVNINQLRGSVNYSNVLIGETTGTDLKSGGNNSILISTGGDGYELRADGYGNVLVSTVGADRVLFYPSKGWELGDLNTMLGFNPVHGDFLDLSLITNDFVPGSSNINSFVQLVDGPNGEAVMFNSQMFNGSTPNLATTQWVDLLNLDLTHGLTAQGLYNNHNLVL